MLDDLVMKREAFADLMEFDALISRSVAAEGCPHCRGPLHQSNYGRKPRGGAIASAGEAFTLRHSLCCGREACRKRTLPPSLRFLGRRVYLEIVVVLASVYAQGAATLREAREATQVSARTLLRWSAWWKHVLPQAPWWAELRARFVPPAPDEAHLPRALLARLTTEAAGAGREVTWMLARCLAPGTTRSPIDSARFVRDFAAGISQTRLTQKMPKPLVS